MDNLLAVSADNGFSPRGFDAPSPGEPAPPDAPGGRRAPDSRSEDGARREARGGAR